MNSRTVDRKRINKSRRDAAKARNFPTNTCPASRHLHIMAESLLKKPGPKTDDYPIQRRYPMLAEEPEHCAESILCVITSLWEARTKIAALERRFGHLMKRTA